VRIPTMRSGHSGTYAVAAAVTASFRAWLDETGQRQGAVE
jgi:hypothetical protein